MASKNLIYKVNGAPRKELIEKYNNDPNIFFRFQEPHQKLTSRSCSWGMVFQSKAEAIRDCGEWGMSPEEAILPGKSCTDTLEGLQNWVCEFDNDYVVLVFEGTDTGVNGHDGEYVATYHKKIAVWSIEDVKKYLENVGE